MGDQQPEKLTRAGIAARQGLSEEQLAAQLAATRKPGERILVMPDDKPDVWKALCEGCDRVVGTGAPKAARSAAERHNQVEHVGRYEVRMLGGGRF
jgi:predicted phosphoribosyltransferase